MPPAILFGTTLLALYFREDVAAEDRIHIYAALDERSRQVRGLQPSSVTIAAIARTEARFFGLRARVVSSDRFAIDVSIAPANGQSPALTID